MLYTTRVKTSELYIEYLKAMIDKYGSQYNELLNSERKLSGMEYSANYILNAKEFHVLLPHVIKLFKEAKRAYNTSDKSNIQDVLLGAKYIGLLHEIKNCSMCNSYIEFKYIDAYDYDNNKTTLALTITMGEVKCTIK